jgi:hypothetical protein
MRVRDGGADPVLGMFMKTDINAEAEKLAADPHVTDYDFWRSLKNLNNEIFHIANSNEPIPFAMIRQRAILKQARSKRGDA